MSAIRYGEGCTPAGQPMFAGMVTPEPDHSCSGGYTRPGVLGGWTCPCSCHRDASQTSASVDVVPEERAPEVSAQTPSDGAQ